MYLYEFIVFYKGNESNHALWADTQFEAVDKLVAALCNYGYDKEQIRIHPC